MVGKVELIPISDGNRITVKENEKVIVGRGSSLGCNEKKISRHHAELMLKDDSTLWIKPTHANPVFYRPTDGKTIQLPKDIERELKDGDQIGLLPSSYFFRVSFSTDLNNNNDADSNSPFQWKKEHSPSPVREKSPDQWSLTHGYRRSSSNQDISVFDFDDDINIEPTRAPCKRISFEKKTSPDVQPKPVETLSVPSISLNRVSVPSPPTEDLEEPEPEPEIETKDTNQKARKLPKWMASSTTPSPVVKEKKNTPKSSYSRSSSYTAPTSAKRHLSFEGDTNESSNTSDVRSPATPNESKSPAKVLSKIPAARTCESDEADDDEEEEEENFDSVTPKTPPPPKKTKAGGKRRPICQFGATCYRKNPLHRTEHSHPGDSDYEDCKQANDAEMIDDPDGEKPDCPFGKSCYRQNPQHKRDFKH